MLSRETLKVFPGPIRLFSGISYSFVRKASSISLGSPQFGPNGGIKPILPLPCFPGVLELDYSLHIIDIQQVPAVLFHNLNPPPNRSPLSITSWRVWFSAEMRVEWQHQRPRPVQATINITSPNGLESTKPGPIPSPTHDSRLEQPHLRKRGRHRADVDGEESGNIQKKKRRLRLNLITSRLSKPYATPATHISGRRAMRLGVWSRQKVVGRNFLQKAAVLNSMRMNRIAARAAEQRRSEFADMTSIYDNVYESDHGAMGHDHGTRKPSSKAVPPSEEYRPPYLPIDPPSYDLEDDDDPTDCDEGDEDDDNDDDDDDDDDDSEGDMVYSDFSLLDPDSAPGDDGYCFFSFEGHEVEPAPLPLYDSSEKAIGLILENERIDEVSVAHCGP